MRVFFAIIGVIAGVVAGIYLGFYLCFVGGLIDIIHEIVNAFSGDSVSGLGIAWGLIKMCIAGITGWISFYIFFVPSAIVLGWKSK